MPHGGPSSADPSPPHLPGLARASPPTIAASRPPAPSMGHTLADALEAAAMALSLTTAAARLSPSQLRARQQQQAELLESARAAIAANSSAASLARAALLPPPGAAASGIANDAPPSASSDAAASAAVPSMNTTTGAPALSASATVSATASLDAQRDISSEAAGENTGDGVGGRPILRSEPATLQCHRLAVTYFCDYDSTPPQPLPAKKKGTEAPATTADTNAVSMQMPLTGQAPESVS